MRTADARATCVDYREHARPLGVIDSLHTQQYIVRDELAYAVNWWELRILDVSDPLVPALLGRVDLPNQPPYDPYYVISRPAGTVIDGGYAYIAKSIGGGLVVVDVRDPRAPLVVGQALAGNAMRLAVHDGHAFVANTARGYGGVSVFGVSRPTHPGRVAVVVTPGYTTDVAIHGDHLFAADGEYGVVSIDVSDPMRPVIVDRLELKGHTKRVEVHRDLL